jgi:hypothetical protein
MTGQRAVGCGGGLGAVPGGPQKGAVAVSGRRPAILAPFVSTARVLVSDANEVDPKVVRGRSDRSWGILGRRSPRTPHRGGRR